MTLAAEKTSTPRDSKTNFSFFSGKEQSKPLFFQPKLTVGPTNDVYEQEADAVADKVMRMEDHEQIQTKISPLDIQRKCAACEEEDQLQRKEDRAIDEQLEAPSIVSDALGSGGKPLGDNTRSFMESRFGYDFNNVKVHTDTVAAKSAQSINALAYTSGNSIVFNEEQYSPGTEGGKKLIAHELTHVVQQNGKLMKKEKRAGDNYPIRNFASPDKIFRNVPPPPPPRTSDSLSSCNTTQTPLVAAAIANARTWINNVEPRLVAFNAGTASTGDQTIIQNALNHNFHTTVPGDVAALTSNFGSLKSALNSFLDVECVSSFWCEENWLAYVRGRFAWIRRLGDINLCPLFFSCSNSLKTDSTIVHEVAHQYPGAEDIAYERAAAYATLTPADAMNNAESYAVFAREVFYNGSHGPGETC